LSTCGASAQRPFEAACGCDEQHHAPSHANPAGERKHDALHHATVEMNASHMTATPDAR
jgi:hypothetical protein